MRMAVIMRARMINAIAEPACHTWNMKVIYPKGHYCNGGWKCYEWIYIYIWMNIWMKPSWHYVLEIYILKPSGVIFVIFFPLSHFHVHMCSFISSSHILSVCPCIYSSTVHHWRRLLLVLSGKTFFRSSKLFFFLKQIN